MNDHFEHTLQDVGEWDMVAIDSQIESNQNDKPIGISFRGLNQLSIDAIWSVFEKFIQSNSRFNALDMLTVLLHSVRMP